MPIGNRIPRGRRRVRDGDSYTIDDERERRITLEMPERRNEPPVDIQGEPWGWKKEGDKPRGWPGPEHSHDDPGPYDGDWEPPERADDGA